MRTICALLGLGAREWFVVIQLLSCVWCFMTPWTAAHKASLSFSIFPSLLRFMTIELVIPSNHHILCCPLLRPSVFPRIRVFSNELALHARWPRYWSFSFSIGPSNDCWGLISFRDDWFYLLAVQGTLKSLLQHHSSKVPHHSAFFMVQLSHPYMIITGKTIAMTRQTCLMWACLTWARAPLTLTLMPWWLEGVEWGRVSMLWNVLEARAKFCREEFWLKVKDAGGWWCWGGYRPRFDTAPSLLRALPVPPPHHGWPSWGEFALSRGMLWGQRDWCASCLVPRQ